MDEAIVENELDAIGALVPNERIKLAYKCGRDMVICTTKRMLYVDTQGFSGKRIDYLSMRYSCIKGYEVETAGSFLDRDAEFRIFTNISQEYRCIETELRKGQCDVMEVLWYFNNRILGMDSRTLEEALPLATAGNNFHFAQHCQLTRKKHRCTWVQGICRLVGVNLTTFHFNYLGKKYF